jgi:hypothetical protein
MDKIAKAFIQAKKEFAPAMKTSTNPHFKSKYTDLAACVEAVDDAFLNNGIVMYQETFEDGAGVTVETVLLHESGQQIRCGKLHVPASKNDPQGYGSALTYARRYSLMAACGIAPEDDDGNAASKTKTKTDTHPTPQVSIISAQTLAFAVKALEAAAKNGTAELRKVWEAQTEEVRHALKDKLHDWKMAAAIQDAELAIQA